LLIKTRAATKYNEINNNSENVREGGKIAARGSLPFLSGLLGAGQRAADLLS